jgi:hypothetical protein
MVRTTEDGRVTEVVIMHFDKIPAGAALAKPKRRRRRAA